jgi:hypothetical protein
VHAFALVRAHAVEAAGQLQPFLLAHAVHLVPFGLQGLQGRLLGRRERTPQRLVAGLACTLVDLGGDGGAVVRQRRGRTRDSGAEVLPGDGQRGDAGDDNGRGGAGNLELGTRHALLGSLRLLLLLGQVGVEAVVGVGGQGQFVGQHGGVEFGHFGDALLALGLVDADQAGDHRQQRAATAARASQGMVNREATSNPRRDCCFCWRCSGASAFLRDRASARAAARRSVVEAGSGRGFRSGHGESCTPG